MTIYTRTGDKGKTSLFDGTRVLKSHVRVDAYGTVDELNSAIGFAIAEAKSEKRNPSTALRAGAKGNLGEIEDELERIQNDLLDIGSALATPHAMPVVGLEDRPKDFEKIIDALTGKMPELRNFILPGGGKAGASLHVCRTIARRVERKLVALMQEEEIDQAIVVYTNRLSDLLFTMARFANHTEKKKELKWSKK